MSVLFNRRAARSPASLIAVVGLHAAFIYALLTGLGLNRPATAPPEMKAVMLDPRPPVADQPPRVEEPTVLRLPPLEQPFTPIPFEDAPTGVAEPQDAAAQQESASAEPKLALIAPHVDFRHPLSQPPYPMSEVRAEHEGALTLLLYVDTDGRVIEARVASSSGFSVLDEAAIAEAKRRWRLTPASRGGVAFKEWTKLRVVFRLDQR